MITQRYWNLIRFRNGWKLVLYLVMMLSVTTNFLLLSGPRNTNLSCPDGICQPSLDQISVRKVLEYIESQGEVDSVVRDAFVKQIWRCMKNTSYSRLNPQRGDVTSQFPIPSSGFDKHKARLDKNVNDVIRPVQITYPDSALNRDKKIETFLSLPIVNPHEYSYIFHQRSACSDVNLKFIIAVPSAPDNFNNRLQMRAHRAGKFAGDAKNRAKLLFFLGMLPGKSKKELEIQKKIVEEQARYGDIVQSSFVDHQRNMTKKAALILRWSSTFCDSSVFVLRMDDDLRANLSKMSHAMEKTKATNTDLHFILGNMVHDWGPVREKKSKYYTTLEEYPYKKLPDFILGGTMGFSVATARLLFKASQRLRPFWLDDVFITAMCAPKVGVTIHNSSAFKFEHWKW